MLVEHLKRSGHEAVHVRDVGLAEATDARIMEYATLNEQVVVSGDTDFGELLARSNAARPSVVLFRRQDRRRAEQIGALLAANLDTIADDLKAGAIVVFNDERIRVRRLPFRPN